MVETINKKNKMLYINCLSKKTLKFYDIKLEAYMKKYISRYFDIISIFDIENIDLSGYELVLINATCFKYNITQIDKVTLFNKLEKIKHIGNIVVFLHDIHDYSFNFEPSIVAESYMQNINGADIYVPIIEENDAKNLYNDFFQKFNISHLISLYDCPEYEYFVKKYTTIKKFYLTNHGYPKDIFKPISCHKEYDILFYGKNFFPVYPLRHKLSQVFMNSGLRFKFVKYRRQSERNLCDLINRSWLCISCVSNFSYFVRKYLEISACNAIVIGDINRQGFNIIGSNMIIVNDHMKYDEILEKTKYYLDNKEIIAALSFNKLDNIEQQNYQYQVEKLDKICTSIVNNKTSELEYNLSNEITNVDSSILHKKNIVIVDFIEIENNLHTVSKLSTGLYVFAYNESLLNTNFEIYDENNTKLSIRDTYVSDVNNQNISYIPFKIYTENIIRISGIKDASKLKLYNILLSNGKNIIYENSKNQ